MHPPSLYLIRNGPNVVGYSEQGRPYILGFSQEIHAHLVAKRVDRHPILQMYRSGAVTDVGYDIPTPDIVLTDTDATLLVANGLDLGGRGPRAEWQVSGMEYNKFVKAFTKAGMGVLVPYAYITDDEELLNDKHVFRCQIFEAIEQPIHLD
jgi:hypothetical protein